MSKYIANFNVEFSAHDDERAKAIVKLFNYVLTKARNVNIEDEVDFTVAANKVECMSLSTTVIRNVPLPEDDS